MSNSASISLNLEQSDRRQSLDEILDSRAHSYGFAKQRWQSGIMSTIGTLILAVSGVFLLVEIPKTPGLQIQMAILGVLLVIGSIVLLAKAYRDFFGSLVVDREGIRVRPGLFGFFAPWDKIARWEIRESHFEHAVVSTVLVWLNGNDMPFTIPAGFINHHDLNRLRNLLHVGIPQ